MRLTGRTSLSHVVGKLVLQSSIYLVMLVVISVNSTALWRRLIFTSLNGVPCLTVRTKRLREFKQGLLSYSGEWYERTLNYY